MPLPRKCNGYFRACRVDVPLLPSCPGPEAAGRCSGPLDGAALRSSRTSWRCVRTCSWPATAKDRSRGAKWADDPSNVENIGVWCPSVSITRAGGSVGLFDNTAKMVEAGSMEADSVRVRTLSRMCFKYRKTSEDPNKDRQKDYEQRKIKSQRHELASSSRSQASSRGTCNSRKGLGRHPKPLCFAPAFALASCCFALLCHGLRRPRRLQLLT